MFIKYRYLKQKYRNAYSCIGELKHQEMLNIFCKGAEKKPAGVQRSIFNDEM